MPRGGPRSGRPGAQYSNRSDLQAAPRLAPQANTGQPYGTAKAQEDAQTTLPMGPPPIAMNAPTQRPTEPVQSGLSIGPGVGPEAIPSIAPAPGPDPDVLQFAQYLPALELMTTLPGASAAVTNLVRRLRGAVAPEDMAPPQ
jgi:hypothetical protein